MSQRERYLAIAVAIVVGLFGVQFVFNKVTGTLREKQDAVDMARSKSSDMDKVTTSGKIAARKIEKLASKSLPKDPETLVAQYRDWLTELGKDVDMENIKVTVPSRPIGTTSAYSSYNFTLRGFCRTDRVLDLLAKFYDKDYLHSVKNFKMSMTKEANIIDVQLDTQALALDAASAKQEPSPASSGRLTMSVDEYKAAILGRNPFAPPNMPPRVSTAGTHTINRGDRWSLKLDADDPESHGVDFELVSEDLPPGMQFRGGAFDWRPEENGEHEVVVRAIDDGWPAQSTEQRLVFKVVDPPVPEPVVEKPKFDVATQAFVSAIISGRQGPEVWIRSRTDGNTVYLKNGANFELGTIKAKVVDINLAEDYVELESDGMHWTIGMDTSLADAFAKSQID